MTKKELIEYYERQLEKVKIMYKPNNSWSKERCEEYIAHAEKDLNEVKNGRNW
jgi:hypothetical protein